MRLPIRVRLTLVVAVLNAMVLGATGLFLYFRFGSDLLHTVDSGLRLRADTLLATADGSGFLVPGDDKVVDPDEAFVQVFSRQGRVLASSEVVSHRPLLTPPELSDLGSGRFFTRKVPFPDETVGGRLFAVQTAGGRTLVVGSSLEERDEALERLAGRLRFGAPAALGLTTWIGWLLAGGALRPVERMRSEAAAISASEPGMRLPVPETSDEIARLGETLNSMLGRMEAALERERRFVDDASHELRTPLGILKAELELALRKARPLEELEAALRSAAEETDNINRLAEDLLVLARTNRGRLPVVLTEIDLDALISDVAMSFEPRASGREIKIVRGVSAGLRVRVDPLRIRQAISNLVDNALRHAPVKARVEIHATLDNGWISITVADSGVGFPPEFIAEAFEPFARADRSRTRSEGGTGLGLAIVRAIAEAHGGSVVAANRTAGGAEVTLKLRN